MGITERRGTSRTTHLQARLAARGHAARTAHPAALRRAFSARTCVSSAMPHRRRMVRADQYPSDLRAVFSRSRSAACTGADDDARGRGRNARMVYEIDATRGRARLHLRLPAYA